MNDQRPPVRRGRPPMNSELPPVKVDDDDDDVTSVETSHIDASQEKTITVKRDVVINPNPSSTKPKDWQGSDPADIKCDVCQQPYGFFVRDPFTGRAVHSDCVTVRSANFRQVLPFADPSLPQPE